MSRVKFYSEYDLSCSWELDKVIELIKNQLIDKVWSLKDIVEFYNVMKFIQVERFNKYLEEKTNISCAGYIKKIKSKIGIYLSINKTVILSKFDELDFIDTEDFLEIIENYNVYKEINDIEFSTFLNEKDIPIYMVLKHKKIVDYFDAVIKDNLLSDPYNAETVLSKFLDDKEMHLPPSLNELEILKLIDDYIEINADRVNINVLRKIIHFPTGIGLNITDKIKLHAIRKEKEESEKIFSRGTSLESSVSISYKKGLDEAIKVIANENSTKVTIIVNRDWIEENSDFSTLWNNFIYLFNIVDRTARVTMVSKKHENSTFMTIMMQSGDHLYRNSFTFNYKEMVANAMINSYVLALNALGIRIEDMIEWFFCQYLVDEFAINNFIVKMPSDISTYFEKCRTILPEIDRIFKQYNALIEENEIDQELIQISSSSVKIKDVKSFNLRKYVYPNGDWFKTATFLLFSDQSHIFYIPKIVKRYNNFFDLIIHDNVKIGDFQEYQISDINWLFENDIVSENEEGFIKVKDTKTVFILKELYYEEVLNYLHYDDSLKETINVLEEKKIVYSESSLLTKNEQDYFDYYLNKAKFTNGYDLRNRYLHGTNKNDEKQYQDDYYAILKLIIIIVLKINDDLCLNDQYS